MERPIRWKPYKLQKGIPKSIRITSDVYLLFIYWFINVSMLFIYLFIYLVICLCMYLFIQLLSYLFIDVYMHLSIYSIYLFIHLL